MSIKVCGGSIRIFALTGLIGILLPVAGMASTPPVQPSLLFEISNSSSSQNTTLTLSVTWNGIRIFNKPMEHIII